jgi:methionine-rich copper-binding protein CopC
MSIRLLSLGAALGLLGAGPALAHAHLKAAVPAAETSVAEAPAELDLGFSEGVNLAFTGLTLTGPDRAAVPLGTASLRDDDRTLVVPVPARLGPGTYTVSWHALARDGHKTEGRYTFTIKP